MQVPALGTTVLAGKVRLHGVPALLQAEGRSTSEPQDVSLGGRFEESAQLNFVRVAEEGKGLPRSRGRTQNGTAGHSAQRRPLTVRAVDWFSCFYAPGVCLV